jgi:MarR family transcriptional regulator, lower aerobic nicotinate degradation pathway regulator
VANYQRAARLDMPTKRSTRSAAGADTTAYRLDDQIGFLLRQVHQRHASTFAAAIGQGVTPTQWAALAKLAEIGACSQNQLGRLTAMDVATIKGVVDRLIRDGQAESRRDPDDARRIIVALTPKGRATYARLQPSAIEITSATLAPLSLKERDVIHRLLRKLL